VRLRLFGKIFLGVVTVLLLLGALATALGVRSIDRLVRHEAQTRVTYDLRIARQVLQNRLERIESAVAAVGNKQRLLATAEPGRLAEALEHARREAGVDFLAATDPRGIALGHANGSTARGEDLSLDAVVQRAIRTGRRASGVVILSRERLVREGGDLARSAHMVFEPTPRARPRPEKESTSGLVLESAVPVRGPDGTPLGLLVGGVLLNRNYDVVDRVKDLVFGSESYAGREVGTVTLFQWDVRISTNVLDNAGRRAIQTRVSREVYDAVLEAGRPWIGRAFVVNDWYLTAYEPLRDIEGRIVGMLYVGVLEAKYLAMRRDLLATFLSATGAGLVLVVAVSALLARALTRPLRRLAEGSERLARGEFSWRVPQPRSRDELFDLTRSFNRMSEALAAQRRELEEANARLAAQNEALERLNRNYMEMLGFVSHELKGGLGSGVTSALALRQGMAGPLTERQRKLVDLICRAFDYSMAMTHNFLNLSRIERGELEVRRRSVAVAADILDPLAEDIGPQVAGADMTLSLEVPRDLEVQADPDLLRIVFQNLVGNAVKYGRRGGRIRVFHRPTDGGDEFHVWNEGVGVPPEKRDRLFTKFGRLHDPRLKAQRGTGLGLFITRTIVERHGGRIRVECEEGSWIDFLFTLPAVEARGGSASGGETAP